jgi:ADP-heptose:LPS heptosyltransferase
MSDNGKRRKIRLRFEKNLAPGDYVVTTALLRDIQLCHPGQYDVDFSTHIPAVYTGNPYVSRVPHDADDVVLGYHEGMKSSQAGMRIHFTSWLHKDFSEKTGIEVLPQIPRPEIFLTERERKQRPIEGKYWVMMAGGKMDVTIKHWDFSRYKELSAALAKENIFCAQSGHAGRDHVHPPVEAPLDLVGWGYLRELFWQIFHAEGVICPITAAMHIAAAFEKPCVVIAGGREEPWWEAYDNQWGQFGPDAEPVAVEHKYLHTLGKLDCCLAGGCWRNKVVKIDKDKSVCEKLAARPTGAQILPACMDMISVDDVVQAVHSYYDSGLLARPESSDKPRLVVDDIPWQPKARETGRITQAEAIPADRRVGVMAHSGKIGTKITIFAHLRGDKFRQHKKLLDSIVKSVPRLSLELRILGVGLPAATCEYALALPTRSLDEYPEGVSKYGVMREAFNDEVDPIETKYVVWFDDTCIIASQDWLNALCDTIIAQGASVGAYGLKRSLCLPKSEINATQFAGWCAGRPWFAGKPLRNGQGVSKMGGEHAHYFDDDFFALRTDAIAKCQIPDPALEEAGGAMVLGEQLYHGGFKVMSFNVGRAFVRTAQPESLPASQADTKYPWQ